MHFEYVFAVLNYVDYKLVRVYLQWSTNENLKITVIKDKWPVIYAHVMYVFIYATIFNC